MESEFTQTMLMSLKISIAAALVALVALPAAAQETVRSEHGDWRIICSEPTGAPDEQCALRQDVTAEDREEVGLTVIVTRIEGDGGLLLRTITSLGVLLPVHPLSYYGIEGANSETYRVGGLRLSIDGTEIGHAEFLRCIVAGCYADVVLDDELLGQLSAGTSADFVIWQTPEEGIGIPVSLAGFGEGVGALP